MPTFNNKPIPHRRLYTPEFVTVIYPVLDSMSIDVEQDYSNGSIIDEVSPSPHKRKLSIQELTRQQKQRQDHDHNPPSSTSDEDAIMGDCLFRYVDQEKEQSKLLDSLLHQITHEKQAWEDTTMSDALHNNELDELLQELEKEKTRYEYLERQLHHIHRT